MQTITKFTDLNLSDTVLRALEDMGFEEPTPIQAQVIPYILEKKDVIAQAPTGTGKTCAFALPIIETVDRDSTAMQVLILCPTRELVLQTTQEFKDVLKYTEGIRISPIYGGQNIERQLAGLRKKPQIIVGTPGRVIDHLERKTIKLHELQCLVLDEADEMLNMGFREALDVILKTANKIRQTVLFSATMPKPIVEISKNYQIDPISIATKNDVQLPNIEQIAINLKESEKVAAMTDILDSYSYNLTIAFCNTKKRADELAKILNSCGYNAEALHGDLRQSQRDRVMKKYRDGKTRVLVATDVAARGIDVDNVEAIFNFDTPNDEEYYVHRIGRTARANKSGVAYTFYTNAQKDLITKYERYTKTTMTKMNDNKKNDDFSSKKLANLFKAINSKQDGTKAFINKSLKAYNNEHDTDFTALDLLAVVLDGNSNMEMTANNSRRERERRERVANNDSTRFFINIGIRDKADSNSLTDFITNKTELDASAILEVRLLDNYGFVEVVKEEAESIMQLNGKEFKGRAISIEKAGEKSERKPSGDRKFKDSNFKDKPRSGSRDFGRGERKFGSNNSSRGGSGEKREFKRETKDDSYSSEFKRSDSGEKRDFGRDFKGDSKFKGSRSSGKEFESKFDGKGKKSFSDKSSAKSFDRKSKPGNFDNKQRSSEKSYGSRRGK